VHSMDQEIIKTHAHTITEHAHVVTEHTCISRGLFFIPALLEHTVQ